MTKFVVGTQRVIKWNPHAHTVVRGSTEPYELGPIYELSEVDQSRRQFKPFRIHGSKNDWDKVGDL
ncbi:hypothetical protein LFYK43_14190 [Ligilactobacillus salitolerans]|uniref:Uncharacterized protein n=1 Tax=Ligilactobacillus salitolerans TaxID=1808352 RepID=A0A401ITT7_9LACO|nr:hypothetical protein [Ligilactobacillus salitolerans]GBG94960.1 hypothetical protein LFYK43_14190 [Ligilactobacillus salitolerans]